MKNMRSILAIAMALILTMALFAGCSAANPGIQLTDGGTLCLKVNPEIAIHYDADGNVTSLEARNADAKAIVEACTGFEGKPAREVVADLVAAIGEAGYFVDDIDGERRQITIEIESGSALPSADFLTGVADEVRVTVNANEWSSPVRLEGITDYDNTDYGPDNDGVTDYDHKDDNSTDYGPDNDGVTDFGTTDYNDNTDYGVNADGNTDYNDPTDYGATDYNKAPAADATAGATAPSADANAPTTPANGRTDYGVTDYNDTDYGPNNDGVTDFGVTDYNVTDYDATDYNAGNA